MKYAIIGSREPSTESYNKLWNYLLEHLTEEDEIVTGGAFGGDTLGMRIAVKKNIPITVYVPNMHHNRKAVQWLDNNYELAKVIYTGLSYSERDKIIADSCDVVYMPDYGNGTLATTRRALERNCRAFTTGTYKLIGKARKLNWSNVLKQIEVI